MTQREKRVLLSGFLWFVAIASTNAVAIVVGCVAVFLALCLPDDSPAADARRRNGRAR